MGNRSSRIWTSERKAAVAVLLQEGLSATEIGSRLSVSRNAVIGIIHRDSRLSEIGLAGSVGGARTPKAESKPYNHGRTKTAARRPVAKSASANPRAISAPVELPATNITCEVVADEPTNSKPIGLPLIDLKKTQCRFPVNDPAKGDEHLFCGHWVLLGTSYCEHHYNRVYLPRSKGGAA